MEKPVSLIDLAIQSTEIGPRLLVFPVYTFMVNLKPFTRRHEARERGTLACAYF
jgi:hypothetical protein